MNRVLLINVLVAVLAGASVLVAADAVHGAVRWASATSQPAAVIGADRPLQAGLRAEFLGQDGGGYVGPNCTSDSTPDNIHIAVQGTLPDRPVSGWEVHDVQGCGHWIEPCNGFNWWLKSVAGTGGTTDLYLKPHRDAPAGTLYAVIVHYADGTTASTMVTGSAVECSTFDCRAEPPPPAPQPPAPDPSGALVGEFVGQDGHGYVGWDCLLDSTPDNIHIRVKGIPAGAKTVGYQVEDPAGYGLWVYPCNNFNWWLRAEPDGPDAVDLFVKPHRNAPDGASYVVTLQYADGTTDRVDLTGTAVHVTNRPGCGSPGP